MITRSSVSNHPFLAEMVSPYTHTAHVAVPRPHCRSSVRKGTQNRTRNARRIAGQLCDRERCREGFNSQAVPVWDEDPTRPVLLSGTPADTLALETIVSVSGSCNAHTVEGYASHGRCVSFALQRIQHANVL